MTRVLGAERVPAGFTITTEACVAYMEGEGAFPDGLEQQVAAALERLEAARRQIVSATRRTPCSCRCAQARASRCRGCSTRCSTSGSTTRRVIGLAERSGNERFAWDSYRRFAQMFGNVVLGIAGERFEQAIAAAKAARGVDARHRARRRCAARADGASSRASTTSPRIRASSSPVPFARCSTPGRASGRWPTGASTASPTTGARRSTSSRWSSATSARAAAAVWPSRATS